MCTPAAAPAAAAATGASAAGGIGSAAMGLQIAGLASGVIGSYQDTKTDKLALEQQAAVSRNNAQYADWQVKDTVARGQQAEFDSRLQTGQIRSSQRARMAARGVALDEGSPLAILQDTDYMGGMDVATIQSNTQKEAWGRKIEAQNYRNEANALSGSARSKSPLGSAAGTLLTGAGAVAESWYRRKSVGVGSA